jgi:glycerol-3-phosphate acyltransferase PlsX
MPRIALDAMGGDLAPETPVVGAVQALDELPHTHEIVLVGRQEAIESELRKHEVVSQRLTIVDAPEQIGMSEKPLAAVRSKPRSSIRVGLELQKRGEADAFISAGNTGAIMAASLLLLGLHPGVERPAIGTLFPTGAKPVLVLDSGANIDCSARELRGFAHVGAVYARDVLGREHPVVGLLNIGEEAEKGTESVRAAYALLEEDRGIRFAGNVEGRDILDSSATWFSNSTSRWLTSSKNSSAAKWTRRFFRAPRCNGSSRFWITPSMAVRHSSVCEVSRLSATAPRHHARSRTPSESPLAQWKVT